MSDSPSVNSSKTLCTSHVTAGVPREPFHIECDSNDVRGRYVFIEGRSKHLPLQVCDVEVFGSPGRNVYFYIIITSRSCVHFHILLIAIDVLTPYVTRNMHFRTQYKKSGK